MQKTHDDFDPSLILDFGRDVTGYPEITIAGSAGGVFDVLYGEGLYLTRVDTFILKGGRQVLQPFNRRTFRYMKLLFREVPEPIEIEDVSMEMNTYPVEARGRFACSDPLLDRIWEVGAYSVRMSMLDHFVDFRVETPAGQSSAGPWDWVSGSARGCSPRSSPWLSSSAYSRTPDPPSPLWSPT